MFFMQVNRKSRVQARTGCKCVIQKAKLEVQLYFKCFSGSYIIINRKKLRFSQTPCHLVEACILSSSLPRQHHLCCQWKDNDYFRYMNYEIEIAQLCAKPLYFPMIFEFHLVTYLGYISDETLYFGTVRKSRSLKNVDKNLQCSTTINPIDIIFIKTWTLLITDFMIKGSLHFMPSFYKDFCMCVWLCIYTYISNWSKRKSQVCHPF